MLRGVIAQIFKPPFDPLRPPKRPIESVNHYREGSTVVDFLGDLVVVHQGEHLRLPRRIAHLDCGAM